MPYGTVNADLMATSSGQSLGAGNATGFKNRIINGAMVIDQRNAGASGTTAAAYTVDRWLYNASQNSKGTWQQNAGSVTPPAGFTNYLGFTSSSAYSVGASDYFMFQQPIEGFNTADLGWGTANAKTVTLSFWAYSSLTGTFGGALENSASNRSYPFSYTISSANTWTQISITIPGDTTGTWVGATNGIGIVLRIGLGVGSTFSGTANAWAAGNYFSATGATSVVGTNGATWYITGVQLEVGESASSFEVRSYGTEYDLCRRYCEVYRSSGTFEGSIPQGYAQMDSANRPEVYVFYYPKRAAPSITGSAATTFGFNNAANGQAVGSSGPFTYVGTSTTGSNLFWNTGTSLTPGTLSGINNVYFIGAAYLIIDSEL